MKKGKKSASPSEASPRKASKTTPPKQIEVEGESPPTLMPKGAETSFEAHKDEARSLTAEAVATFNGNALITLHNARAGVDAVMKMRAAIESDPSAPKVDFGRVAATVHVAEALVVAARRASQAFDPRSELAAKLTEVYALRDTLLVNAVAASKGGPFDAVVIARIQGGRGAIDAAQDCIDLASLFHRHAAALAGRSFVTATQIARAAELGTELLSLLKPNGVATNYERSSAVVEATTMRDRMAALLATYYAYVARVGGWLWGLDAAAHVPPLRSRTLAPSREPGASNGTLKPPANPS